MKMNLQMVAFALVLAAPVSFAVPNGNEQPLPPLETVLKRVAEQVQDYDDERSFKQRYSYVRGRVTEYRNSKGELRKREEKIRTNSPASAPIASRPQPSEGKPQNANSKTEISFDGRGKAFEKGDFVVDSNLLSRFEFTLVGREMTSGRSALVVDFKPAAKQPPERNIKDKFINKAAGRAWVDEEEYTLVKADLHLTERVNVIGGLVGAVWKFNYNFDRERTPDGFWYARLVRWHLEGREVFFRRTIDYHEEKTAVKKVW